MFGWVKLIPTLWKAKGFIEDDIKEVKTMPTLGKGILSTEFLSHVVAQAIAVWGVVQGFIPAKWSAIIVIVAVAGYNIGRVLLKAYTAYLTWKASNATTVTSEIPAVPVTTTTTIG